MLITLKLAFSTTPDREGHFCHALQSRSPANPCFPSSLYDHKACCLIIHETTSGSFHVKSSRFWKFSQVTPSEFIEKIHEYMFTHKMNMCKILGQYLVYFWSYCQLKYHGIFGHLVQTHILLTLAPHIWDTNLCTLLDFVLLIQFNVNNQYMKSILVYHYFNAE